MSNQNNNNFYVKPSIIYIYCEILHGSTHHLLKKSIISSLRVFFSFSCLQHGAENSLPVNWDLSNEEDLVLIKFASKEAKLSGCLVQNWPLFECPALRNDYSP